MKMSLDLKKKYIFLFIFAQSIDCGYMLEPPGQDGSNEYPQSFFLEQKYPCIPQFYYIKAQFKGVSITRACFPHGFKR